MTVVFVIVGVVIGGAYIYAIAKPLGDMADGWKIQEDWCRAERLRLEARTRGHMEESARLEAQIQKVQRETAEIEAETEISRARGEAEANRIRSASLNGNILQAMRLDIDARSIEKWDGKLPSATGASGIPFMPIQPGS